MLDRVSISDIPLFSGLGTAQLEQVRQLMRFASYQRGEIVIEEGAPADNLLYIVIGGEAAHSKKGRYPLTNCPLDYEIVVQGRNEIFGWVPVLDGSPSPVTVMARTPLTVAVLDLTPRGGLGSPARHIRNIVIAKLRHYSSELCAHLHCKSRSQPAAASGIRPVIETRWDQLSSRRSHYCPSIPWRSASCRALRTILQ